MKPVFFKRLTPGDFFRIGKTIFMKASEHQKAVVIISDELGLGQSVMVNPCALVSMGVALDPSEAA